MNKEIQTLLSINRHIILVQKILMGIAHRLEERAIWHDWSKFSDDEFGGFIQMQGNAYSSSEYNNALKSDAVKLHHSRNSHHPEYYPNGISDMSLLDLIEMVADWIAAARYDQKTFEDQFPLNSQRFKLTDEQSYVIMLIAKEMLENGV